MGEQLDTEFARKRLTKLFEFLKAYADLRFPPVTDIRKQVRVLWLKDLPDSPAITVCRGTTGSDAKPEDGLVLRVVRADATDCPPPPGAIAEWLKRGWQSPFDALQVFETKNVAGKDGVATIEKFDADPRRRESLEDWRKLRDAWISAELPVRAALNVFQQLYEWFGVQEREGENVELIVGDGILNFAPESQETFYHPVLLQKLQLEFVPNATKPEFVLSKRETPPELYVEFLRAIPESDRQQLAKCTDELKEGEFSPLGGQDTEGFLRRLVQGIFPRSGKFLESETVSDDPDITIYRQAVIFMRSRRAGLGNFFDLILEDISNPEREEFSPALLQILDIQQHLPLPEASEAEPGGLLANEDIEVLLSKPANREQLAIARQLVHKKCVLVQGPPGTGKTHTIANLLGHLLSEGKRVLITAHTAKALRVVREKVAEPLQALCISALQGGKQSQEELESSIRTIHARLSQSEDALRTEANGFRTERERILSILSKNRRQLLEARQAEIRDVLIGGSAVRPISAAKQVREGAGKHDWIPSPVTLGVPLPLASSEIAELYNTNARISVHDEREISRRRPDIAALISPEQFRSLVAELHALSSTDLRVREDLWAPSIQPPDLEQFDQVLLDAQKAVDFLRNCTTWELDAIQAGRDGEKSRRIWESLLQLIEETSSQIEECHQLVMEFGPQVSDARATDELLTIIDEVIDHQKSGRPFGLLAKVTKRRWFEFFEETTVNGRPITPENLNHLRAVKALLRIRELRSDLLMRWDRQMATKGAIPPTSLGERPEHTCRQFTSRITSCLDWYHCTWRPLEARLESVGFTWAKYFSSTAPQAGEHAELQRLRVAVMGELESILQSRVCLLRYRMLRGKLETLRDKLGQVGETDAAATTAIRGAVEDKDISAYDQAFRELGRLHYVEPDCAARHKLLDRLRIVAPGWASSIQNRAAGHEGSQPPGEPEPAWLWRQLHDELERRAAVSINKLQQEIEQASLKLLDVTAELIDRQTWLRQIQHVSLHPDQKRALAAYTTLRGRLTKTGTGKRDAEFRAAARIQLALAKDAVPVWIMPLSEAAASFDPRKSRFDVVIIDEASQCDPTSLFALYLGKSVLIVGDDEQVTPLAVGQQYQTINDLIHVHLGGIPNKELYSGDTSIYELAQIAFGGIIRLTEHFRCAPDIIAFSNNLSYGGQIQPLREASSVPVSPHVVEYRVASGAERDGGVNEQEAEVAASLMCAAMEQPEFKLNDKGKECSFGAVSLVGEKQAILIDTLLRKYLDPVEYRRRQVLCGDAAQFQGDERDVMFISMVDASPEDPPLAMRQEGPKNVFKKRFNVAASRARNQMWVVHSLQHDIDLQVGDYRRRLIEHAIDPGFWKRDLDARLARVDPRSKEFQGIVLRRLVEKGLNVVAEYPAGAFSIDLVVIGERSRLAIECDGEQFHGPERLQDDIERQTVLERLGWKFVRIRGSLFFRDEARALRPVFERLNELGIRPGGVDEPAKQAQVPELVARIATRANELRTRWHSQSDAADISSDVADSSVNRLRRRFLRA